MKNFIMRLIKQYTCKKYKKQDICCENCTDEGTQKYYSIDTSHDRCGECCKI